jgi:hypothetical protein
MGGWFGLTPLPPTVLAAMLTISLLYAAASEFTKRRFYRRIGATHSTGKETSEHKGH